jgi:radical SAM protein with 4Fe4S-binding SPASM domain
MINKISINEKSKVMSSAVKGYPLEVKIPNNIMIEVTNICNLKCKMCYNQRMKRKKGLMSFSLFKKIVDQAHELNIENIGLYTTGESFLHPRIFEFIKYAKDKGIKYVYITTNGQALNDEKINKIIESRLDSIKFSIDAGNKEKYETLKINASWEKLIDNITKLRKMRDNKKSNLRIFASFIIMEDNFNDLIEYKNIFSNLIDETNFSLIGNQGTQVNVNSLYPKNIISNIHNYILPKKKWHPCNLLWNRLIVTYEGYLTICCIDFENKLIYGDLNQESLKESWNNKKIKKFREIHKLKQFEELPLCFNCDAIKKNTNINVNEILRKTAL